jgi:hypothetical protein
MHIKRKAENIYGQETHEHSWKMNLLILRNWMTASGQIRHGSIWIGKFSEFSYVVNKQSSRAPSQNSTLPRSRSLAINVVKETLYYFL